MKLNEDVLREELAKKDFDLIEAVPGKQQDTFDVSATKLHSVHVEQGVPVYMPVSVNLQVTLDDQSRIKQLDEETSDPAIATDSENFAKTLLANKQIDGLSEPSDPNPTHQIIRNEKGQQVIRRRNFSAY